MIIVRTLRHIRPQILTSFALALALFLTPAASQAGNLFMVAVGLNNAQGQAPLTAPAKDAKDMAAWARTQQNKLFANVNVITLTDNNATRKNVLANLTTVKNQARAGDYLIFYNSSHGGKDSRGQYIMSMYDGNMLWSDVLAVFNGSPATKIAILDTCDAGLAMSTQIGAPVVFASSKGDQNSLDVGTNSLYTLYLLQGLNGKADTNKDGLVSLVEAAAYASKALQNYDKGKKTGDQQNSTFSRPANIDVNLPLAKLTKGFIGNNIANGFSPTVGSTVYSGTENLPGFGKLSFTMQTVSKVVMHDAKNNAVNGTYTRTGTQVTLSFPQVGATYHGTMNGFQIAGSATDTKGKRWTFSVNRTK